MNKKILIPILGLLVFAIIIGTARASFLVSIEAKMPKAGTSVDKLYL